MTGSNDRDPVLAAAIEALPVPDHADGFWATLTDGLHDGPAADPLAVPGSNDNGSGPGRPAGATGAVSSGRPTRPVRGSRSGRRSGRPATGADRRRWLLVAAVVALVGGIGIGVLVTSVNRGRNRIVTIDPAVTTTTIPVVPDPDPLRDGTATTATATGSGTVPAPALPAEAVALRLGQPVQLGTGNVAGLSADGRSAYLWVNEPASSASTGSECDPLDGLYLQTVGSGGRTRAGGPGQMTGIGPIIGPGGRLATVSQCETTIGPVTVAQIDNQGRLTGRRQFSLVPNFPGGNGPVSPDWAGTIQWSADGSALLLATGAAAYRVDPAAVPAGPPDQPVRGTDLGLGPVVALGQGRNGELAVVLADGRVQLAGVTLGTVIVDRSEEAADGNIDGAVYGITRVAVDDQGGVWVASLRQGLVRLAPGRQPVVVEALPVGDVVSHPGGGVLWKTVADKPGASAGGEVRTLGPGGVVTLAHDSAAPPYLDFRLDPGGRAVLTVAADSRTVTSAVIPLEVAG